MSPGNFNALGCLDEVLWTAGGKDPPVLQRDKKAQCL